MVVVVVVAVAYLSFSAHVSLVYYTWYRTQIWSREDRQSVLNLLATSLINDQDITVKLATSLHIVLIELLYRAQQQVFNGRTVVDNDQHRQLCIAFSKLACLSPDVQWYAAFSCFRRI